MLSTITRHKTHNKKTHRLQVKTYSIIKESKSLLSPLSMVSMLNMEHEWRYCSSQVLRRLEIPPVTMSLSTSVSVTGNSLNIYCQQNLFIKLVNIYWHGPGIGSTATPAPRRWLVANCSTLLGRWLAPTPAAAAECQTPDHRTSPHTMVRLTYLHIYTSALHISLYLLYYFYSQS